IFSYVKNISRYTIDIFSNILLISLLTIFLILSEPKTLLELNLYKEIRGKISLYMNTKTILSVLTGIITFVICLILNIESAFLISVLTFMLNFIPTVGSIVATAIPIPIILLQYGLDFHLPVTLGLLLLNQFIIGNVIETKIFGDSLGIHPFLIFFSLAFWGFLWGISGMFLSIPLALLSKLLFDEYKLAKANT
ncbi:AI-2E family transporter, partial [Bacteriovoracaceae bacterium]|nr:AI-2E family transporter [Bacteriovoracaceae bacterium]